jgi:hypothetical protein
MSLVRTSISRRVGRTKPTWTRCVISSIHVGSMLLVRCIFRQQRQQRGFQVHTYFKSRANEPRKSESVRCTIDVAPLARVSRETGKLIHYLNASNLLRRMKIDKAERVIRA